MKTLHELERDDVRAYVEHLLEGVVLDVDEVQLDTFDPNDSSFEATAGVRLIVDADSVLEYAKRRGF